MNAAPLPLPPGWGLGPQDSEQHPTTDLIHSTDLPEITYDSQDGWIAYRLCIGGQDFLIGPDALRALKAEADRAVEFL